MVYLYKIETKYKELIAKYFTNENIIDAQMKETDESIVLDENEIIIFSSHCSEIERKNVKSKFPKMKCFIFFEEYVKNIKENTENYHRDFNKIFIDQNQWIDSLQIPVAKHCNLNCNRCYHFSNLVREAEYYSLLEYKKDMLSLKNLHIYIGEIRFLGGEPLLNNQILDYIEYARVLYPHSIFKIITNGLLVKQISSSQWERLLQWNVIISISIYPPMLSSLESLEKYLKKLNANYEIFRFGNHFEKVLLRKPNAHAQKTADECGKCVITYNGRIGRCATGMFVGDFNNYFNMAYPENNVENIDKFTSSSELIAYIDKTVPLCNWCIGDERVESYPWSKSKDLAMNDYIIEN